jgi:hypothetical protein
MLHWNRPHRALSEDLVTEAHGAGGPALSDAVILSTAGAVAISVIASEVYGASGIAAKMLVRAASANVPPKAGAPKRDLWDQRLSKIDTIRVSSLIWSVGVYFTAKRLKKRFVASLQEPFLMPVNCPRLVFRCHWSKFCRLPAITAVVFTVEGYVLSLIAPAKEPVLPIALLLLEIFVMFVAWQVFRWSRGIVVVTPESISICIECGIDSLT